MATLTAMLPPRAKAVVGRAQDQIDLAAGSSHENRFRLGKSRQDLGRAPENRPHVGDAKGFSVGFDQSDIGRLRVDRIDRPLVGKLRGLDRHRARPGADIPDDAGRADIKLGQGNCPHLGLRDQPRASAAPAQMRRRDFQRAGAGWRGWRDRDDSAP